MCVCEGDLLFKAGPALARTSLGDPLGLPNCMLASGREVITLAQKRWGCDVDNNLQMYCAFYSGKTQTFTPVKLIFIVHKSQI